MPSTAFAGPAPLRGCSPPKPPSSQQLLMDASTPLARLPRRRLLLAGALAAAGLCALRPGHRALADSADKILKTPIEWQESLSPMEYMVLRENRTERAFSSPLNSERRRGVFRCAGCGNPLFESDTKYESGTGWPSFFRPLPGAVVTLQTPTDRLLLQKEVRCARCDGHLGHVFADGPQPTGLRYCMNGVALAFEPSP